MKLKKKQKGAVVGLLSCLLLSGTSVDAGEVVVVPMTKNPTGNATPADVLKDKTFSSASGVGQVGTMEPLPSYNAATAQTGQVKCTYYNVSAWAWDNDCSVKNPPSQDGEVGAGTVWPSPRFTDNGDGTVTDNLTGLIWLQQANCGGGAVDWSTALSFVAALYDAATDDCGLSDGSVAGDWRVPNIVELLSLLHRAYYNPALPDSAGSGKWSEGDPFTGVQNSNYWSSTSYALTVPSSAWYVSLGTGLSGTSTKSSTNWVWAVRAAQ